MQGKGHGEIHLRGWYWPFDMLYSQGGNARMVRPPVKPPSACPVQLLEP